MNVHYTIQITCSLPRRWSQIAEIFCKIILQTGSSLNSHYKLNSMKWIQEKRATQAKISLHYVRGQWNVTFVPIFFYSFKLRTLPGIVNYHLWQQITYISKNCKRIACQRFHFHMQSLRYICPSVRYSCHWDNEAQTSGSAKQHWYYDVTVHMTKVQWWK